MDGGQCMMRWMDVLDGGQCDILSGRLCMMRWMDVLDGGQCDILSVIYSRTPHTLYVITRC